MAEESTETMVDNEGMANDFFDSFELVDNSGEPIEQPKQTPPEGQPKQDKTKDDTKPPESDGAEEKLGPDLFKSAPKSFTERFLKQSDTGEHVFDPQSALNFFKPDEGSKRTFSYQGALQKQQDGSQPPPPKTEPEVEPWRKAIDERKSYQDGIKNSLSAGFDAIQKAYGDQMPADVQQAIAYGRQFTQQWLDEHMAEYDYKQQVEREKTNWEAGESSKKSALAEVTARSNQNVLANEVGGWENFNHIMFSNEVGGPVIMKLFDVMNPNAKNPTQADMNAWWNNFASDMNNLQFAYELAESRLQRQLWPQIVSRIGTQRQDVQTQQRQATTRAQDGIKTQLPKTGEVSDLDKFLNMI